MSDSPHHCYLTIINEHYHFLTSDDRFPVPIRSEEDQAKDIGNMHKKFGKDHACVSGDILADRQTHRHTH